MNFKLMTTKLSSFYTLSIHGEEPVRNYKKTVGLIASRMGDRFVNFLAEPRFEKGGSVIDWYYSQFDSKPVALSTLSGAEHDMYARKLANIMSAYSASLPDPEDDVYPLMTRLVIVPDEDCIFCADGKVAVAQWGLKPRNEQNSQLNLLSFAVKPGFKPEVKAPEPIPEPEPAPEPEPEPVVPEPAPEPKPVKVPAENEEIKRLMEENKRLREQAVNPAKEPVKKKKKRPWLKWLLIILAILAIAAIIFFIFRSCSKAKAETVDQMEATAPSINNEDIVLNEDSVSYIVSNRLAIMVKEGGDLNEFTKAFREHYPDQEKYKLVSPDTVFNRVVLICPSDERAEIKKNIKEKITDFKLIVTDDGVSRSDSRPNDPAMAEPEKSWYFDMVNAIDAWDIEKGNSKVVVAILDGDIDITHPEIKDKIVATYNTVDHTETVNRVPACEGHGTHTSSTAVGYADNSEGAAGIAPGCSLMAINVFHPSGYSSDTDMIEGVRYAVENGANIISISIGTQFSPMVHTLSPEEQKALAEEVSVAEAEVWDAVCKYAEDNGVLIVKSAGNENVYSGLDPNNRSSHELVVAAVDDTGQQSIWDPFFMTGGSNFGDVCQISAPGTAIYNAVPNNSYEMMNGTSMATPMVAGGAALLKSHNPSLTPVQLRNILVATANPKPTADIGPIMDLVAALNADPENPGIDPGYKRELPIPVTPMPTIDPISYIFNPSPDPENPRYGYNPPYREYNPTPNPGTNPGTNPKTNPGTTPGTNPKPNPGTNPGTNPGYGQPSLPFPVPKDDCGAIERQYKALEEMRDMIEEYMERLRRECPECL